MSPAIVPCLWFDDQAEEAARFYTRTFGDGLSAWLTSRDTRANDRAFQAVMGMKKLDIAALDAAFAGR